jgi:hypothetical protein
MQPILQQIKLDPVFRTQESAAKAYIIINVVVPGLNLRFYTFPVPTAVSTVGTVPIVGFTTRHG